VIAFIERLTVPSGEGAGGLFKLRPFQKRFIRDVYEPHYRHGRVWRRRVRRAILSIARKNGKTALIAALVLVHLIGPEAEQNGEIYSAATERDQAAIVFKFAAQLVRANPVLKTHLTIVDSLKRIACHSNGSFYQAVSAEAGSKMGFNPTVAIYDELAQAKNPNLFDALDTSMGARAEPLFIIISTQSADPNHVLSENIDAGLAGDDPTTVCHLYETPEDADLWDEENWYAANPALGDFRSLEDMRALAKRAKRMPSRAAAFKNLNLNMRVDARSPLIPQAEWDGCIGDAEFQDGEAVYLAADLSSTTDLSALVMVSAESGSRLLGWGWKPADLVKDHAFRDRFPYDVLAAQGHLELSPGRTVDRDQVALKVAELCERFNVLGLAYDRWRIDELLKAFDRIGLIAQRGDGDGLRLFDWGQGFKDMGPAIDALETAVLDRTLQHADQPVLNFCISNAIAVSDPAGNRKLDKSKARFRIDLAVAAAMALGLKARERPMDITEPQSVDDYLTLARQFAA